MRFEIWVARQIVHVGDGQVLGAIEGDEHGVSCLAVICDSMSGHVTMVV